MERRSEYPQTVNESRRTRSLGRCDASASTIPALLAGAAIVRPVASVRHFSPIYVTARAGMRRLEPSHTRPDRLRRSPNAGELPRGLVARGVHACARAIRNCCRCASPSGLSIRAIDFSLSGNEPFFHADTQEEESQHAAYGRCQWSISSAT